MQVASITARLSADFDAQGKRELALYERKLDEVRHRTAKREQYKAKLGADYDPKAFNAMERDLKKVEHQTTMAGKAHGKFLSTVKSTAGIAVAAGGIATVGEALSGVIKAANDSEQSMAKVRVMVKNAGISYEEHAAQIDKVIEAQSRMSGFDDEELAESFGNMIRTTGNLNEALKLNQTVMDVARLKGVGLAGAQSLVARVYNGSYLGLKRLGINIEAVTTSQDRLKSSGEKYTAQELSAAKAQDKSRTALGAMEALQRKTRGTAEAYGKTAAGANERLQVSWENLQEAVGQKAGPAIAKVVNALAKFINQMVDGEGAGGRFADQLSRIGGAVVGIGKFLTRHTDLIKGVAAAWVAVKVAAGVAAGASKAAAAASVLSGGRVGAGGAAGRIAGGAAAGSIVPGLGTVAGAAAAALAIGSISAKAGHAGKQLKEFAQRSSDAIKSRDIGRIREMARSMDYLADHSNNAQKGFQDLRRRTDGAADALEDWRNKVRRVNRDVGHSFEVMKTVTQGNLGDIRRFTRRNAEDIKDALGKNTTEGRKALARNFALAAQAVRDRMRETGKTTRAGTAEIERLMVKSLTSMGLSRQQAVAIRDHGTLQATSNRVPGGGGGQRDRAMGGWIGRRGQKGGDTVPIMAGEGEAVLSGPQQQVVEGLLGQGFLDQLFTTVQRPHYFARGGRVGKFASGGIAGAIGAADKLDAAHFPYVWGGGHSGSPAPFGPMDCSGAVSYVLQHGGVDIPTMVSGQLAGAGQAGPGGMTVYANPVHTFMRIGNRYFGTSGSNPGGGAGWFPDPGEAYKSRFAVRHFGPGDGMSAPTIRPPVIGGDGSIVALGNQALGVSAAGANSAVARALSRMGLGAGDAGDPGPTPRGGYSKAALMRLWVTAGGPKSAARMAAAIAMAESRGDPNASNTNANGSIDRGLWQINSVHGAQSTFDPVGNARSAIGISGGGSNWGPWTTYNSGAYRSFLARGGFVKAAKGLHSQDPRARRRPPRGRYNPAPPTVKGILGLKLAPGYGVDVYDGQWDIFRPTDDTAGPKLTRAADRLDLAMVRAITDTPTNFQDDLNIARWQEHLWAQVYFGRVARHAPGSKIRAAAEKLNDAKATIQGLFGSIYDQNEGGKVAPDGPNGPEGPADVSADMQAIIDQTNVKLAASQANVTALQGINTAFGSSGDIGAGGFANAFQAGAGAPRVTIYQTNQMMHPSDPQVLATLANATVSGMSLQSSVATTRSKVGL